MNREDNFQREDLFGDLPFIPHSTWRHDHTDHEAPTRPIDPEEFWDRLGL